MKMYLWNIFINIFLEVSDDSDYTSDVSYPINNQANINYPISSMSQSNIKISSNENTSPLLSTKKPLAFVQPVIRDLHSTTRQSMSITKQESLSHFNQTRKLPKTNLTDFNYHQK